MKKKSQLILLLRTISISFTASAITKNNWYEKSRHGLFVHYVPSVSIYPGGGSTSNINVVANAFDAKQLAADAQAFGMEYVILTAMHYRMRPLYPSAVTEKWRPGNSSSRDCIRDLINELKPKGIKLILYVHTTDGYDFVESERVATGFNVDSINHYPIWNNYVNELMTELGNRYKTDIDGIWQDMCMSKEYKNMMDKPRLRASMLAGDPNRILIGNGSSMVDGMDYTCTEYYPSGAMTTWRTYPYQIATVVGGNWTAGTKQGTNAARLTPEQLYRFTVLQSAVTADGGMAWAAGVYIGGGWEDGVKNMFAGCGNYIKEVEGSLKGTLPSTSYVTVSGKKLSTINNGIVATKSADDMYEYIHVLYPPATNTLVLPVPTDGKQFSEAVSMNSADRVALTQNAQGVTLQLIDPEKWDTVNSVIRLTVKNYVAPENFVTINNNDTLIKYIGTKWVKSTNRGAGDFRDDVSATTLNGDYLTLDFVGDGIEFMAPKGTTCGNMEFFIDGVSKGKFSQFATVYIPQQPIYSNKTLTYGSHIFKAVKIDANWAQLDYFKIYRNSYSGLSSHSVDNQKLEIFPNPAVDKVNFRAKNSQSINQIQLYSLQGGLVATFTKDVIFERSVNIKEIPAGIYMVKVFFSNKTTENQMLVKCK